jgi:hypothetical protein
MAAAYIESDKLALELGARLSDLAAGGDDSVLSELRHIRAELGLSPLARRRLQWEISSATERVAPTRRPRRDLRAVS